jgi:type II secretory pathway pseudopilin PulG
MIQQICTRVFRSHARSGWTIVELLIVISIIMIVTALVLPSLGGVRRTASELKTLSNIRQIGIGLSLYAEDAAGLPPVFAEPVWPESTWNIGGTPVETALWFDHAFSYSLAITASLENIEVAVAPGNLQPTPVGQFNGVPARRADYFLTNSLYATPEFFDWATQQGPAQFRPQRLDSITFSSSKGLLYQPILYHLPGRQYWGDPGNHGPVAFADGSADILDASLLLPGMLNLYDRVLTNPAQDPAEAECAPVANTYHGVRGRDQ